jgi:thiol-disulfide isomerase/thioredoxin
MRPLPILILVLALSCTFLPAQDPEPTTEDKKELAPKGIEGKPARPLGVSDWIQLPEGKERLEITDFKDKVLVLFLFQSTCEACKKREFPVLQKLVKEFDGNDGVAFLAIQTPFQDYATNSQLQLKPTAEEFNLDIPFGHLAKTREAYSINAAYETGGTPWWVIIDRKGMVEFNGFTIHPDVAIENIKKLIAGEELE